MIYIHIYIYIYIYVDDAHHRLDVLESGDILIWSPICTVSGHVGIAMYPFSSINRDMCFSSRDMNTSFFSV